MADLKAAQARNLNKLLKNEKLREYEFSEAVNISVQTISRWRNGKTAMTANSAHAINAKFPKYSVEYLLGLTEWNNDEIGFLKGRAHAQKLDAVELLIEDGGSFEVDFVSFEVDFVSFAEEHPERFDIDDDFGYKISLDGKSITMTVEEFEQFAEEVAAYVKMRLNLMIERSCS